MLAQRTQSALAVGRKNAKSATRLREGNAQKKYAHTRAHRVIWPSIVALVALVRLVLDVPRLPKDRLGDAMRF